MSQYLSRAELSAIARRNEEKLKRNDAEDRFENVFRRFVAEYASHTNPTTDIELFVPYVGKNNKEDNEKREELDRRIVGFLEERGFELGLNTSVRVADWGFDYFIVLHLVDDDDDDDEQDDQSL